MSDESTAVLQGQLERAVTGDAEARQRLLELTRDRLMHHARRFLHGRYARLEPFAQSDDVVQQLYLKILRHQDRFWVNARGEPVRNLAEYFSHTSAWMRDVLCYQLREAYGRDDNRTAVLPLDGGPFDTGMRHDPSSDYIRQGRSCNVAGPGVSTRRRRELPDDLRAVFDLLWYQGLTQAEAAALLGVSVPTVKLRWMKSRLRVQQALDGSPFDEPGSSD